MELNELILSIVKKLINTKFLDSPNYFKSNN